MQYKIYKFIPYVIVALAVIIGARALTTTQQKSDAVEAELNSTLEPLVVSVPSADNISAEAMTIFRISDDDPSETDNKRYRLAGTFFLMSNAGTDERRRLAIIDDVEKDKQYIVSEGQSFQEHEVLRIYQDKLILRKDAREIILDLSFADAKDNDAILESRLPDENTNDTEYQSTKYGKQIGERRWVLQKEALNNYYKELLDDPDRIAAIYTSLKADFSDDKVAGYRLEREGEDTFFDAVGLTDGDVIRKVNSMNMTSQKRAEYFLSEFMQDRLGAVVLDIERDGKNEKMIYLLR